MIDKCEFCNSTKNILMNHFEKHIFPNRSINTCRICHGKIHSHLQAEKIAERFYYAVLDGKW